ncbi:beta-propeller fold lactonase family protein [Leptospira vanthielii]|uniref:Lactonase, 7-bladed beta-propeller domain protein n=1 Tax=Leptospira vanthielii serovar Holland str. Waz Holland = ATCC 700522 TaxID=1218591 RepID=N1WED0_9LEPT|nr:beta-propeller fold lactonase family protein [Leptospira vanthielii]EMY71750.1 lactonase, 7-bladed beta-propeller domain protein [Leptospira vanthielii serovar Holland str. Waz Holland = ATCC 700522]
MKKLIVFSLLLLLNCNFLSSKRGLNNYVAIALGTLNLFQNDGELPAPIDIVAQPTLTLPANTIFDSPDLSVYVQNSSISTPNQIGGLNVPIGKVYDVEVEIKFTDEVNSSSIKTVTFNEPVVLEYHYNKNELDSAGFLEEFQVFYFSKISNQWEPLRDIVVDHENGKILAKTDHFTPFILTAVPKLAGTGVAAAPTCLSTEMPIEGSSNAVWTRIDEHFKYYKDRNYTLNSNQDFLSLGFPGSFGIATCNGGEPSPDTQNCGPFPQHKYFDGSDYIKFTASEDIKVYIMYDSRGSQDATWLTSDSWVLTDKQIESTDGVGYYKVYEKQFLKNDVVRLHGNRLGIPANAGVETNYWVVVKPVTLAINTCLGSNSIASQNHSGFQVSLAIAGSDSSTLLWKNTILSGYENLIVRRKKNIPPTSVEDGVAPNVNEIGEIGFRESGLETNSTYYYAFFGRTSEGSISLPNIVKVETGMDSDNDGITDTIETNGNCLYRTWHDFNCNSNPTLVDTDSDGFNDLTELINNTKLDSNDTTPPVISKFELITKPTTSFPYAIFSYESSDEVNTNYRWTLTSTNLKPTPGNRWAKFRADKILEDPYFADVTQSPKDFFLWIRDDSGNISSPAGPITITRSGYTLPYAIATSSNSNTIKFSFVTPWMSLWNIIPNPINEHFGQFLYQQSISISGASETFSKIQFGKIPNIIYAQSYNQNIGGNITVINLMGSGFPSYSFVQRIPISGLDSFVISEDGRNLYALNALQSDSGQKINLYRIQPDGSLVFDKRSGPVNQIKYDKLVAGKNQTIYATNYDYANITRVNGESLELMPVTLRSYETHNLRFHPNGKFCYQVNPVPSELTKLEKCLVNSSNGDLTFENNVLTTNNQYIQFEITPDGNYMVVIIHENYTTSTSSMVLYKIDPITGNLTEKNRISNVSFKPYSEFRIDPSSQFIFLNNKESKLITFILDHNNEKIVKTELPFFSDIGLFFDIQFSDWSQYAVQTNISHTNQPGFVHGVNDVKYPLPFTTLLGGFPTGTLLWRAYQNPISLNIQNTDLGYMTCGKQLSNYEETIEIKNDQGVNRIQSSFGNIWNRSITIQNLATDLSFSGRYKLQDISSSCRPNDPQEFVGINITKKRLSSVFTNKKLPAGQKPTDLDSFTSAEHTQFKGNILPFVYYTTRCTIHEYGCNFLKLDKPKIFYCEWIHTNKTFNYYKSKAECAEKEKGVMRLHHLTLITNVEYSYESNWRWDKYQVTDP